MALSPAVAALVQRLDATPGLAPVLLMTLLVTTVVAVFAGRWWALPLIPQAVAWPLLNHQLEGPILWAVTYGGRAHGLSLTDLATPLALTVVAWRLLPWRTFLARTAA